MCFWEKHKNATRFRMKETCETGYAEQIKPFCV